MQWFMMKLLILASVAGLSSCVNYEKMAAKERAEWIGKNDIQLIAAKGVPDKITPLSNGSRIYAYDNSSQLVLPGHANTISTPNFNGTVSSTTTYSSGATIPITRIWEYWIGRSNRIDMVTLRHN